jgi:hypothetical protein
MEGLPKRLSLPKLDVEFYEDRIVVRMLTKDAMTGIDPGDDFMFIADIYDDWKNGPVWLDQNGQEVSKHRWTIDSDTGWIHYFNDEWTIDQKRNICAVYVFKCCKYDQPPIVFHPSEITLCVKENCLMFGDKILCALDPEMDEDGNHALYKEYLIKLVKGFLKRK